MQKKNLFQKKLNKSVLSITKRIESFFDFIKVNFFTKKKKYSIILKTVDNRIFLVLAIAFMTVITYFLLPAFYDKNKVKVQIENQIIDEFNLKVNINTTLKYGLFPKPHFSSESVTIKYNSGDVAQSSNLKIFISVGNFFSVNNLIISNLLFKQTDFKIKSSNFKFFVDLLNVKRRDQNINFANSKFFYLDQNDDVIFITSVKKLNYLYQNDFLQKLNVKLNIFNIPLSIFIKNDIVKNKLFSEIKIHPLRLNIKNQLNYDSKKLDGEIDVIVINKNKKVKYTLDDNLLNFRSVDDKLYGDINIIPFYLFTNLKLYQINLKSIFSEDSILVNILKSEFLNNENLSGKIAFSVNNFKRINFLDEIKFDIIFENGDILIQNLNTNFKKSLTINVNDTQVFVDNNKLKFAGYIKLDFLDIDNIFRHYQINKTNRNQFEKISFSFLLSLDEKFLNIDNLEIDGKPNIKIDQFLNEFNFKKDNIFNKVIRRNLVKDFFKTFSLD